MAAASGGNRLLAALSADELSLLAPHLDEITLPMGRTLAEPGQAPEYVYFPVTAVLSLVGTTEAGATVEVAVVGREGMASVSAALGRQRLPFRVSVQLEGVALRAPTKLVTRHLHECRELHDRLLMYSHSIIVQVAQSAICNRFHSAKERLARWLLMTCDRAGSRELPFTHEFIAHLVGGPRSAVTEAAAALRVAGAIDYRRGSLTVRNFAKLRQQACECYEVTEEPGARK